MVLQPKLHQFSFGLLVGDNFLRESAHLWVLAVHQLGLRHLDSRLMMGQHKPREIDVAVT